MAADDSMKVRNGAIPSRCGSAPPCFEEAFAAIRNSMVTRQSAVKNSVQNNEAEDKFLSDPAYVAYYDANVNLNPRLPPPLISREGRHLVGRNAYLSYARRLPSTHEEQLEEDMFRQEQQPFEYQTQVKDELMARSNSVSSAVQDNVAAHDPTTSDIAGAATILKALNISGASPSKNMERKHEDRLLCETYGLPFCPPNYNTQQLQRFQMFPSAQPNFTGIRPMMISPGFLPAPYMVAGSEFGPSLQILNPFGPQIGPGGYMFTPPFDPYVDFNLFNRAAEVQRAFPDLFQGQYIQHSLRNKYDKESEFATFTHHHPRNLPTIGDNYLISAPVFSPSIRFPVDGRNHLALGDHTSIPQCSLENAQFHTRKKVHRGSTYLEDPETISLLEELKLGGGSKLELSDIAGKAVEFSTDQHGSRFIQQKLEVSTPQEKESIFTELLPLAAQLMTDVFGNYVIQKLFEHGTSDQRKQLADQFTGRILTLSLHMYGCRVIQKAIEVIDPHQKELLAQELNGYVISCVHDQNGNHVVQKCIEHIPAEKISFIISALHCEVATLSVHPYGCRVIQRVLEHCSYDSSTQFIMDEILESVCMLAQDQYGNYVIQHVLKLGKPHERSEIISKLIGKVVEMSQHKYASNVIEKCLIHGNTSEQESVVREVLEHSDGDANLLAMMKDPYANYVIQRILEICSEEERKILMKCVGENIQSLKKYTYGKHIVALYEQQV